MLILNWLFVRLGLLLFCLLHFLLQGEHSCFSCLFLGQACSWGFSLGSFKCLLHFLVLLSRIFFSLSYFLHLLLLLLELFLFKCLSSSLICFDLFLPTILIFLLLFFDKNLVCLLHTIENQFQAFNSGMPIASCFFYHDDIRCFCNAVLLSKGTLRIKYLFQVMELVFEL